MNQLIAKRYAQALFELSRDEGNLKRVAKDIAHLTECLAKSIELNQLISNPVISFEEYEVCINTLFKNSFHATTLRFLMFLCEKARLNVLPEICIAFDILSQEEQGILNVTIQSPFEMTRSKIKEIETTLAKKLNKTINARIEIIPALIAGIRILHDDQVLDFSIKEQLNQFREQLLTA